MSMNSAHQRFKVISHMIMIMKGIYSFTQKKKEERRQWHPQKGAHATLAPKWGGKSEENINMYSTYSFV